MVKLVAFSDSFFETQQAIPSNNALHTNRRPTFPISCFGFTHVSFPLHRHARRGSVSLDRWAAPGHTTDRILRRRLVHCASR